MRYMSADTENNKTSDPLQGKTVIADDTMSFSGAYNSQCSPGLYAVHLNMTEVTTFNYTRFNYSLFFCSNGVLFV